MKGIWLISVGKKYFSGNFEYVLNEWSLTEELSGLILHPVSASVALIYKQVNWFAEQINWLVSIWG